MAANMLNRRELPSIPTEGVEISTVFPLPETKFEVATMRKCVCANGTRYIILALGSLCISSLLSNTFTFNFTVICMSEPSNSNVQNYSSLISNETSLAVLFSPEPGQIVTGEKFNYSPAAKSLLFSAVAIGALVCVFPLTWLMKSFGARKVFAAVLLVSGVGTGLTPAAAHLGLPYFVVMRILQGVGLAAFMPVVGTVTASWASLKENGVFVAVLTGFVPFLTMLAGELCASPWGWPAVYYVHAAITIMFCFMWFAFYRDTPNNHPFVGVIELEKISRGKTANTSSKKDSSNMKIPYKAICLTPSIWAVYVASFGNYFAGQTIIVFMPTFCNHVLGYSIEDSSRYAVFGVVLQLFAKLGSGLTSDKVRCFSENNKLRFYNTLANGVCGIFFILLGFIPFSHATLCVVALMLALTSIGFNTGGFAKSATLVSRHYSQFVMSVVQIIICLSMLIGPFIVTAMTPNNSPGEWSLVFFLHGVLLLVTNLFFCLFASAAPAPWALDTWKPKQKIRMATSALGLPA